MLLPIVRSSAQRISLRSWASTSSVVNLQTDNTIKLCRRTQINSLGSRTRTVSSIAADAPKISENLPTQLHCDTDNASIYQGSEKVPVYYELPTVPTVVSEEDRRTEYLNLKKEKALRKFTDVEMRLEKSDPKACKLLRAIKNPLLELEQYRASALIDVKACRTLISHMGPIDDPSTAIVIGNPGAGILSTELLRKGAQKLVLFESNPEIRAHLQRIHQTHPVDVTNQFLYGSHWECQDNQHHLNRLLESEEYRNIKIIHSLTNPCQSRDLLTNYTSGQVPYDKKNVEIYLVTERSYGERLSSLEKPQQKVKFTSAWRTFIKTEKVCTLPADSFFPYFAPLGFGVKGNKKRDSTVMVLRCTFREIHCVGRPLNREERQVYDIFIRHIMAAPNGQIAHTLEKWTPGIGIRLIRSGFPLFTRFSQLSKEDFERIFFIFLEYAPTKSSVWPVMGGQFAKQSDSMSL